jgi:hypothetical protein
MNSRSIVLAGVVSILAFALPVEARADDLPATQSQGGVSYIMGGIGLGESEAIKAVVAQYSLELQFVHPAVPHAEYLADVKVQVTNARDETVLDVTANGPFLLVNLAAGKYRISADHQGRIERRNVEIVAREHRKLVLEW